jgi:protein-L-isoaspartate(D-aspartate) O-methyltransferase
MPRHILIRFCIIFLFSQTVLAVSNSYQVERERLIGIIEQDVRDTRFYLNKEKLNPLVMEAMATVPRHEFVPENLRSKAYKNRPLPIGYGQTISQPYIVAIMTDILNIEPGDRVLEIGTGSGYQAAILAQLTDAVYTIEIIEPLARKAKALFDRLNYSNIKRKVDDGYYGWEEYAPFDAIIVTAAASHVPPPLIKQLKPGGSMIIPVGGRFLTQQLVLITVDDKGQAKTRQILPVQFVPLTGEH